jgi:formate hydrogenlyase subunit 3/multisubunit Na+/H+ antiporter MnhD subunit
MKDLTIPYIIVGALIYIQGIRVYFAGDFTSMIIYTSFAWVLFLMAFFSYKKKKKPKDTDILGEPFITGGDIS